MISKEIIKVFRLALPITISQLGQISVAVADTIMIGHAGTLQLASATFATSLFVPVMMFGIGVSNGATPLIAHAHGESDQPKIKSLFFHNLILQSVLGIVLFLVLLGLSMFFDSMDQPKEVVSLSRNFYYIISFSLLPVMVFMALSKFAEGLGHTRASLIITIGANLINVLFNYLLIFGNGGFPALGLDGAAYATLLSRLLMPLTMGAFIYFHPAYKAYVRRFSWSLLEQKIITFIVRKSFPVGFQMSLETAAFSFAMIMVGWLGTKEIAAHQIALNLASVTFMGATGISAAAAVRVGFEMGRKDIQQIKKAGYAAFSLVSIYMLLCALGFTVFSNSLPLLYISDPMITKLSSQLLLIAAFFQIFDGLQTVGLGALRGLGDVTVPTAISMLSYWVIGLPFAYLVGISGGQGVEGVWYGLTLGLMCASFFLVTRFILRVQSLKATELVQ
ncbi:MAG TPA: MATE family efflux transporter [Cytophagaceae bacterium]